MAAAYQAGASNLPFGLLRGYGAGDLPARTRVAIVECPFTGERLAAVPSHRPGVARLLEVEELAGGWVTIRGLGARTEEAVAANAATPCALAPSALLICAIASLQSGDDASAHQLEQKVEGLGMEGYGPVLNTFHLRLALAQGDLNTVERLCAQPIAPRGHTWHLFLSATAARLDGLAAIGDRERVEAEAPPLLGRTYLGAFASRPLGTVRTDVGRTWPQNR
jgi:hypothetical protein